MKASQLWFPDVEFRNSEESTEEYIEDLAMYNPNPEFGNVLIWNSFKGWPEEVDQKRVRFEFIDKKFWFNLFYHLLRIHGESFTTYKTFDGSYRKEVHQFLVSISRKLQENGYPKPKEIAVQNSNMTLDIVFSNRKFVLLTNENQQLFKMGDFLAKKDITLFQIMDAKE